METGNAAKTILMEYRAKYITEDIKLSCYEDKFFKSDIMFEHHMLIWFMSGETKIIMADTSYLFRPGDIFLIPRAPMSWEHLVMRLPRPTRIYKPHNKLN